MSGRVSIIIAKQQRQNSSHKASDKEATFAKLITRRDQTQKGSGTTSSTTTTTIVVVVATIRGVVRTFFRHALVTRGSWVPRPVEL